METTYLTYFTKTQLKERGWTEAAIKKYLNRCDRTAKNPYRGADIQLFDQCRVLEAESSQEFLNWFEASKKKREQLSESMYRRACAKREELIKYIENLQIEIPLLEYETLIQKACNHYNDHKRGVMMERGNYDAAFTPATLESDPAFLLRITYNYLRHCLTTYDLEISNMFGQVGKEEAYNELRTKVMSKIKEVYPDLEGFIFSL